MSITLNVNGTSYSFPTTGENPGWGSQVTAWAQAVSQATLQKSGGSFTLTAEVDFGANYGLKLAVLKSRTTGAATTGFIRMAKTDTINFRNAGGTADLALGVGSADTVPAYAGKDLVNVDATQTLTNKTISGSSNTFTGIPWTGVDKTGSNISDLATKSHTSLSDIGTKSHATIDSDIGTVQTTIYDQQFTGVKQWGAGTTYYTITGGALRLDRSGTGYVKGAPVTWTPGQTTSVFAANTLNYVYVNSSGVIGSTTSTSGLYFDYIVLFEVLYDGTNYVVVREDHPYKFPTAASEWVHNNIGPTIRGDGAIITRVATGTGSAAGDRQVKIVGEATFEDHGITTTIPDSAGSAVTWNVYYTNASGKWIRYAQQTGLPMFYNSAGTPTALGTGPNSDTGVYVLYVSKDDLNSSTPTYYAVMNNAVYNMVSLANAAISANSIARATNELAKLEIAQLGYAVVVNNGSGGYIEQLTIAKSTVNTQYSGGGTNTANLVTTNTAAFNRALSSSDSTVQAALDTIDDTIVTPSSSDTLTNKTITGAGNTISGLVHGTQVDNPTSGAHGVTGSFVGTSDAQVITNKDIDGGTASDTSRITVPKAAKSTLDGLTRKEGTIVYGSDTDKLYVDDGSSLKAVGSSSAGSGETNYVTNPSGVDDNAAAVPAGWSNVGDLDIVVTKTAADLPRENITKSGLKITADANTQSTADYVYYDFTLDDVDAAGRIMKLKWDQKITGTYTAGQLEVVITTQADRATAVSTPFTSAIPAQDGTFQTYFLAPSTATCSLVIRATADMTTDGGIVISDVVVGPNVQVQGAAIGPWESKTFTLSNFGNATVVGYVSQIGEAARFRGRVTIGSSLPTGTLGVNLPAGYTVNTSKTPNSWGTCLAANGGNMHSGLVFRATDTSIGFYGDDGAGSWSASVPMTFVAGDVVDFDFTAPVNELSSNVTLANRAVEEYASVGGTWDADGSTTVYGPAGSPIGGTLSTARLKTVTYQSAIQPTDKFFLELSSDGNRFFDANSFRFSTSGAAVYSSLDSAGNGLAGFQIYQGASANQVIVRFNRYTAIANDDSPVSEWPTEGYWRLRKVSGGASVGYPISSANLITTNAAGATVQLEESGTFTGTLTGCTTSPTATGGYSRVGKTVTLTFPALNATSNTTACTITTNIPASCYPARNSYFVANTLNGGTDVSGLCFVGTSGTITLYSSIAGAGFSNSGAKGLDFGFTVSYTTI